MPEPALIIVTANRNCSEFEQIGNNPIRAQRQGNIEIQIAAIKDKLENEIRLFFLTTQIS